MGKDETSSTEDPGSPPSPLDPLSPPAAPKRPTLDSHGMERPRFLLDFPEDPELERLILAFESGNYALIRRDAEAVASSAKDPEVRSAALELRRRIDPDPLAKYLLAIAAALLIFLVIWAYAR